MRRRQQGSPDQHGAPSRTTGELAQLTTQLADIADRHFRREQRVLPMLLRRLPPTQARRLVDDAARSAVAVRAAPRLDLEPALL